MIKKYDNFLNNLIMENVEPTNEFDKSIIDIQNKTDISTKNIKSKFNGKLTNDGKIIDISGNTEYYAIFQFTIVSTGTTETSGNTNSLSNTKELDSINDAVFKLKIKIKSVQIIDNKFEYTFEIIDYLNMNKYKSLLMKYNNNLNVFGTSLKGNKIYSSFIFSKIDNVKDTIKNTFKLKEQPKKIIE